MVHLRYLRGLFGFCLLLVLACGKLPGPQPTDTGELPATRVPSPATPRPTMSPKPSEAPQATPPAMGRLPATWPTPAGENELRLISNESGSIRVAVPSTWVEVRSLPWINDKGELVGDTLMVSPDLEEFLRWKAQGVSISAARDLGMGYLQLLDSELERLLPLDIDGYVRDYDFANDRYRGKAISIDVCDGFHGCTIAVLSLVPQGDGAAYVAEVMLHRDPPYDTQTIYDTILSFEVVPEKLP